MKIKFNSDDNLPLNKVLKLHMVIVTVSSVFQEDGKYYLQVFLDECLYELQMLEYDMINVSEGIDINKTNASKECGICHHWYFLDKNFNYEPYLCISCHDFMQKAINFNTVAITFVEQIDYRIHFLYMSKNDVINIMKNSNLKKVDHYNFFSICKK